MRALGFALVAFSLITVGFLPFVQEAQADHVYTHRYVVEGRVVTESGTPVAQENVEFILDGWLPRDEQAEGPCRDQSSQRVAEDTYVTRTDALGDFRFCIHAHQLIDAGQVVIRAGGVEEVREKHLDVRMNLVNLVVPDGTGEEGNTERFANTAVFKGRLWVPLSGSDNIEGIPATGVAPVDKEVTVTLNLANGESLNQTVITTGYGEFAATFQTDADLTGATFTLSTLFDGETKEVTVDADALSRATGLVWKLDDELDAGAPGPGLFAVLGVLAGMAGLVARRRG